MRTSKYTDPIDEYRLNIRALNLNHSHLVAVNGEKEARVARDGDKPESVTVITAHEKSQTQRVRHKTDRFPCWTFTTAREILEGPPR